MKSRWKMAKLLSFLLTQSLQVIRDTGNASAKKLLWATSFKVIQTMILILSKYLLTKFIAIQLYGAGSKLVINFDGKVAAVEDDRITLDNGQVIIITNDTVFSIANGIVENAILSVGYNIQGYTKDDPTASEVTASRIHIIAY